MALYLDTEFNGHGGELISLALVSSDGDSFYQCLPLPKDVHPWVAEHVIPVIKKTPIDAETFRFGLGAFLSRHKGEAIYADWPADFLYLMELIIGPTYDTAMNMQLNMRLIEAPELHPETPHNALSDAIALANWHKTLMQILRTEH